MNATKAKQITQDEPQALVRRDEIEMGVLHADNAKELVSGATEIANVLAGVIDSKNLANNIAGRKYVRCEGWTTLAAMLGITPREVSNRELDDGSYEAIVELVRINDGAVIGRGSALCGSDEKQWADRPRYARRSMAATRATGKACRLAFSWIMTLAGYEGTPAEEMSEDFVSERGGSHAAPKERSTSERLSPDTITKKQADRLRKIATEAGWTGEALASWIASEYGFERLGEIPWQKYEDICKQAGQGPLVEESNDFGGISSDEINWGVDDEKKAPF